MRMFSKLYERNYCVQQRSVSFQETEPVFHSEASVFAVVSQLQCHSSTILTPISSRNFTSAFFIRLIMLLLFLNSRKSLRNSCFLSKSPMEFFWFVPLLHGYEKSWKINSLWKLLTHSFQIISSTAAPLELLHQVNWIAFDKHPGFCCVKELTQSYSRFGVIL